MTGFQYDPFAFDLMRQLISRQQSHLQTISSYRGANCEVSGAFSGILTPLHGHYSAAYNDAHEGMQHGAAIAEHCATKITASKQQVLEDDKAAYDRMAALSAKSGHPLPPWHAPDGGSGPMGAGEKVGKDRKPALERYLEAITPGRAYLEQGIQGVNRALPDQVDPLKPGELTPDQWADPGSVMKHLVQERLYNARLNHLADNDPGGHDAGYFRQQELLHNPIRFESGFASGQSFTQEHLHTGAGSSGLHSSPWLSEDGRETFGGGPEVVGKAGPRQSRWIGL